MPSFTVPCLSCESPVLIKDTKLIGTKVECPKCKYRFKVEEPAGGVATDDAKGAKDKKKPVPEAEDGAKKKQKSKKIIAIAAGVVAVGVLAVVGFAVMGGGDTKPKPPPSGLPKAGGVPGGPVAAVGGSPPNTPNPDAKGKDELNKKDAGKEIAKEIPKAPLVPSNKETTNLLPGQTVSLYRFDFEKLRQSPLSSPLFSDGLMMAMFKESFGFDAEEVAVYYHTFVGSSRDPFGLIRLKAPIAEKEILSRMALSDDSRKSVKGRVLFTFRANPFINGIASAFSLGSLFGDVYARVPPTPVSAPESRFIGICIYDTQHILVGDRTLLETYLSELDDRGYPKFLSSRTPPKGSNVQLAQNEVYLSIDPKLKNHLKALGSESSSPPEVLYAEKLVQGIYDPKLFKLYFQPVMAFLDPILNRTLYLSANLLSFGSKQVAGTVRLEMVSPTDALELAKNQLTSGLTLATSAMSLFLDNPVELRNQVPGATTGPSPVGPGMGPGSGPGSGPGVMPGPGKGGQPSGMPKGPPGLPGLPGGMAPGLPGGMSPGMPGGLQPPGRPPGSPGSPSAPGTGPMGTPGTATPPTLGKSLGSHVDLGLNDEIITLKIDIHWSDEVFRRNIAPPLFNFVSVIKGKMAIYTSDLPFHGLSMAVPKMLAETKAFPRGTADRKPTDSYRMGLRYPPETRVSFFADLLPFMNRGGLAASIDRQAAWYDERNLPAAEAWVPEFLVPSYPEISWRAFSPFTEGRVVGGTNYVAIAGIGVDAARYNPSNPADAKRVGLMGYDWGSKVEEVTDGLSNTIFLMQTPPGFSQPWIAGGGATIRGLNERDPMYGFRPLSTPNGPQGTYALMGDGSVRFIDNRINPGTLLAMSTRAGGENLADLDKVAPRADQPKKVEAELKGEPKAAESLPAKAAEAKSSDAPPKKSAPVPAKETAPDSKLEVAPPPRPKQ